MASMADIAVKKGYAKGWPKGYAKGKAEMLLLVARHKFGRIPKWRKAQVQSANLEQVEDWADRLLSAPDIDSLFGGTDRAECQLPETRLSW